jgi:hypothetical protein
MATALMQDDDLSMNRFNPYTWTGTYGVSSDGSHNWQPDGTFTRPYDTSAGSDRLDTNRDLKHFDVMALNDASNMWFNTMPGKPTAPFPAFPARKYQNWTGDPSWVRPDLNFNYVYDKDFIGSQKLPDYIRRRRGASGGNPVLLVAVLAVIAYAVTRMKR